jgi:hypothetical protein
VRSSEQAAHSGAWSVSSFEADRNLVFKPEPGVRRSPATICHTDDRFFVYRRDASGVDVVVCLLAERRGEVFRITVDERLDRSTTSHRLLRGKNLMVDLPAGASCDALDDVVSRLRPWRPPLRQGSCSWRCLVSVGRPLHHAQRRLDGCATGGNVGTSSPRGTSVSVRVKAPASSSLGLRNGPLEVQAVTVDTQTAARR